MDLTANKSQHSDNKSNISAELQHFLNGQSDSNVTFQDYLFAFEKKEDTNTNADGKREQKNETQRFYHHKVQNNINAQQHVSYYKRKFEAKHNHKEMNTEKEISFPDAQKTNEFGLTHSFGRNKFLIDLTQVPVDKVERNAVDVRKEVPCLLIKVKKGTQISDCSIGRPYFFDVHKNNKIKLKDNNQNNIDAANNTFDYLLARNQATEIIDDDNNQGIDDNNKSNVHVAQIIDAESKNIDVKTESFNVV